MKKIFLIAFIFLSFVLLVSCNTTKTENTGSGNTNEVLDSSLTNTFAESDLTTDETSNKTNISTDETITSKNEIDDTTSNTSPVITDTMTSHDSNDTITSSDSDNTTTETVKYNITFKYNLYKNSEIISSSINGMEFGTITQAQSIQKGKNLNLSANLNDEYQLQGWYLNNKRLSSSSEYILKNIESDLEIEVKIKYHEYTLKITNENINAGKVYIDNKEYNDSITYLYDYSDKLTISCDGEKDYLDGYYLDNKIISEELSFEFQMPSNDVEIIVKWNIYSITYDLNEGDSNSTLNPTSYIATDDNIELYDATYEGYSFLGWYDELGNKVEVIDTSAKKNYTLKAKWIENENTKYSVNVLCFDYDSYEFLLNENLSYVLYGKTGSLTDVSYDDIVGYDKYDNSVTQKEIERHGNTVIELRYRPVYSSITLEFKELYQGRVSETQYGHYGDIVTFNIIMSDEYRFLGVYSSNDFDDENKLVDDSSLSFDLTIKEEALTYYIRAEKCAYKINTYQELLDDVGYTITFDSCGGLFEKHDWRSIITQNSNNLVYEIPTRDGALFKGWYASEYDTSRASLSKYYTSDKTLYAQWIEESSWHYSGIDEENITLGYVNNKYEICENVYPSNTNYYGGCLVFSPLAAGKVKMFISGSNYESLKIYQYKSGSLNEINYKDDGKYIETSSSLSVGSIYYVLVNGTHGIKYGIELFGESPKDFRDYTSTSIDTTTNRMEKYGDITVLRNAICSEGDYIRLEASTNIDSDTLIGNDLVFMGWYDPNNGMYCYDFSVDYYAYSDVDLVARWKTLELNVTNNLGDDTLVFGYVDDLNWQLRFGDTLYLQFTLVDGIEFDEFEYKGNKYTSDADDAIKFHLILESDVVEIKLYLSYKKYSFEINGNVSGVSINDNYETEYQYNSELNIDVTNDSGHTLKWLINGNYLTYGDSVCVTITSNTTLKYELSNIDIVGGYAYFGSYPQSEVKDDTLLTNLNKEIVDPSSYKSSSKTLPSGWYDYNYYSYSASYSKYRTSVYTDITYNGEKYRAIYIYVCRQNDYIGGTAKSTYQTTNYSLNTIYWFKYEPIKWDILEIEEDGNILLVTSNSIDSTQYCSMKNDSAYSHNGYTAYSSSYEASDIRIWLNNSFYNLAFTLTEKNLLNINEVSGCHETYSPNSTSDYVYILSNDEANAYSLKVENDATGYALAQGFDDNSKASWTRTPYSNNLMYKTVGIMQNTYSTYVGVRPAISMSL